jgi:hypothetical protein
MAEVGSAASKPAKIVALSWSEVRFRIIYANNRQSEYKGSDTGGVK